jgi:hypothetical protein
MVETARGYLTDTQMPKRFWFSALRHASRAMNYLLALQDGVLTTPFVSRKYPLWHVAVRFAVPLCN